MSPERPASEREGWVTLLPEPPADRLSDLYEGARVFEKYGRDETQPSVMP
jgi:hypothetical protein